MQDQISEVPTVFNFLERNPINPKLYSKDNVLGQLGYKEMPVEKAKPEINNFKEVFDRSVIRKQDPEGLTGSRTIEDIKRKDLLLKNIQVLEKDGMTFLSIGLSDDIRIIIRSTPVSSIVQFGLQFEGFQLENLLIEGKQKDVLDMMELRPGKKIKNIITFSDIDSGTSPSRQYSNSVNKLKFDEDVTLSIPTKSKDHLEWDGESLKYLFLHENSHASIQEYTYKKEASPWKIIEDETDANSIALSVGKLISNKFPGFVDLSEQREWVKNQLNEGYAEFLKYRRNKK